MREIKFRAWDNDRSEYLSAGNLFIPVYPSSRPKSHNDIRLDSSDFLVKKDRIILEQFTGVTDKNGVDIYEDDVLLWGSAGITMVCKWSNEDCAFTLMNAHSDAGAMMNDDYIINYIVIGNIHQHPELLK